MFKLPLIFWRNIKSEKRDRQLCPSTRFENCPYEASKRRRIPTNFKGEPPTFNEFRYCAHRMYYGPNSLVLIDMTRQEYDNVLDTNTFCCHPDDSVSYSVWRCRKCNHEVSGPRERHDCSEVVV